MLTPVSCFTPVCVHTHINKHRDTTNKQQHNRRIQFVAICICRMFACKLYLMCYLYINFLKSKNPVIFICIICMYVSTCSTHTYI